MNPTLTARSSDPAVFRFLRTLRFAGRRLGKSPGFTATAVFSLALGIGASTAIFSLVNAVLLREIPLRAPEELLEIYLSTPDYEYNVFSYPDFEDFRDGTANVFSDVAATRLLFTQSDRDGGIEMVSGEAVSGVFFPMLGVEAELGRTLLPEDDVAPGAHPVVMLSHDYWQKRFGGDPAVIGRELRLAGRAYTIVGVAPESYPGSFRALTPSIFAPVMMVDQLQPGDTPELESRRNHSYFVKARLRRGVNLAQAQTAVDAVAADLTGAKLESWDPDGSFLLLPRKDVILYPPMDKFIRAASWLLMGVVGLVLVMACANLASYLLARAVDRRKEIAVRLALGAGRRSLAGQLLTETALLGLLGGALGLAFSKGLLTVLLNADLPLPLPVNLNLDLDWQVLAFNVAISLAAGLFLGLAPVVQNLRGDMAGTLRSESAGGGRGGKLRLRNALVVAQVAMSLCLLLLAGLFVRSMSRMQAVDPGFGTEPSAVLSFLIPGTRYDQTAGRALMQRLEERLAQAPGVTEVGLTSNLNLDPLNSRTVSFNVDGVEPPPGRESQTADAANVDAGFFPAAGIRILAGRDFDDGDRPESRPVAIISEAMARKFWPGGDPIGQVVRSADEDPDVLVVGVASDAKVRSLGEEPRSFVYLPLSQRYSPYLTAVVQTKVDPQRTVLDMVAAVREVDRELFIWEAKTMERHLAIVLLPARLSALILTAFAALALTLAVVGLWGVVSYAVAQRRREVGIRMSLGADGGSVVRLLMGSGLRLVATGGVLGLLLAGAVAQVLSGLLFGISALDPVAFAVLPLVLLACGCLAALIPALAARRIEPASVLRAE